METINKYKIDKKIKYINSNDAVFYKNAAGSESYYHICDNIRPECMPEIMKHDISTTLYLDDKYIRINFCPLCGKRL